MKKRNSHELVISGIGVTTPIGRGKAAFSDALMKGCHAFAVMQRPGRQKNTAFLGAEIPDSEYQNRLSPRLLRSTSLSGQVALVTLDEAWKDAHLDQVPPARIGLVLGGANIQQRELVRIYDSYAGRVPFVRPSYAMTFMDTDVCGLCTQQFPIRGCAHTVGGASASGHLAIVQAAQAVLSGHVDVCIAIGALMDLSYWELQALRNLGAMGSERYSEQPGAACRPFDKNRDGFIFGESCGAVVIEKMWSSSSRAGCKPYGAIRGWAVVMDGNRNPDPSYEGQVKAITTALNNSHLASGDIDYINPHATGSIIGDEIELKAIQTCRLTRAYINTTKSLIGHGLSAAGTVEIIATLLQMQLSRLHPSRNLQDPISSSCNWVKNDSISCDISAALNLSMGFGGINTAICLRHPETLN